MKWTFASFFMVALGLFGIAIIFLFQDITVSNEDDYYLLKEITEAAMIDSIDLAYYRLYYEVRINQEKFVDYVFDQNLVDLHKYIDGYYNEYLSNKMSIGLLSKNNHCPLSVNEICVLFDSFRCSALRSAPTVLFPQSPPEKRQ